MSSMSGLLVTQHVLAHSHFCLCLCLCLAFAFVAHPPPLLLLLLLLPLGQFISLHAVFTVIHKAEGSGSGVCGICVCAPVATSAAHASSASCLMPRALIYWEWNLPELWLILTNFLLYFFYWLFMHSPSAAAAAATSCEISNREGGRDTLLISEWNQWRDMKIKSQSDKLLYYITLYTQLSNLGTTNSHKIDLFNSIGKS